MKHWKEIINEVESELKRRRQLAINNANLHLDSVLDKNQNIKKLYTQRKVLVSAIARAEVADNNASQLRKEYKELGKKIKEKLAQENIKKEEILPNYTCKACKDTGMVNGKYCNCFKNQLAIIQYANNNLNSQLMPSFDTVQFDIIKDEKQRKQNQGLYKRIQQIIEAEEINHNTITIFGDVGVGKTHLMECSANAAIKQGLHTIYMSSFNFNQKMLEIHCLDVFEKERALAPYTQCDVLFIDDLGTENTIRNVTLEYYFLILDERIRKNKLTMLTTNLSLDQIREVYDERIFSRIASTNNALKIKMAGSDLRLNI